MDYPFRLPGGGSFTVRGWGNFPIELVSMLAGVKPATHCVVSEAEAGELDSLCRAFRLRRAPVPPGPGALPGRVEWMLGPTQGPVDEAARVWARRAENPGAALGYPPCCTLRYTRWTRDQRRDGADKSDIVRRLLKHTRPARKLPFLLNNVFYCYSRPWRTGDEERRRRLEALNPGLDLGMLNVLPWHPCAYDCPRSLALARRALKTMRRVLPGHATLLADTLSRPAVFWDWDRFAVLDGKVATSGAVAYRALRPPFSALEPEAAALLRSGDRAEPSKEGIAILSGKRRLGVLPGEPVLLPFSA